MAARELLQPISRGGRAGDDGFVVQEAADVSSQLSGGAVAARLVLLDRLGDDRFDIAAVRAIDRAQRRRLLLADGFHRLVNPGTLGRIRQAAGQKLVQNQAQGVDVGADVDLKRVRSSQ